MNYKITEDPIDVKNIHDIPGIEEVLDLELDFVMYDKGDNYQFYSYRFFDNTYLNLQINSDETLLLQKVKLLDLITQDNIQFLQCSIGSKHGDNITLSYVFRPLMDNSEKNF